MKSHLLTLIAAGVLMLAGCSSTPTTVDTGPIRASTFNFVITRAQALPSYSDSNPELHAMIQKAIVQNLAAKGIRQVPSGGDITVGYLVIVGNNASTMAINDYFGYKEDAFTLNEKAHTAYTENKNPNYFEAGTLVIDLVDNQSFKLIKRNYGTRPILRDPSAEKRAERVQDLVNEILGDLKVKK